MSTESKFSTEELQFTDMQGTMSGEAITWLYTLDIPITTDASEELESRLDELGAAARAELAVNGIINHRTYAGTAFGSRFQKFLQRSA